MSALYGKKNRVFFEIYGVFFKNVSKIIVDYNCKKCSSLLDQGRSERGVERRVGVGKGGPAPFATPLIKDNYATLFHKNRRLWDARLSAPSAP